MAKQKDAAVSLLTGGNQTVIQTKYSPVKASSRRLTDEEVNRIGQEKYEKQFAPLVDTEENFGKFFLLDVVTDKYETGDNLLALLKNAEARQAKDNFYLCRIGRDFVFRLR